jgi:Flp pilus assembly protein TadD
MRGYPMSALDSQKCGSAFGSRRPTSRIVAKLCAGSLALLLAGCGPMFGDFGMLTSLTIQEPDSEKFFPSDEPYQLGVENFNRGHYGVAETRFQEAVEKAPEDASAWVALAATYDRMMRFDFADRAYARAVGISGETSQILNNQGYSHMLRGNLKTARQKFTKAAAKDPGNPTIQNNILLLDGSGAYFARKAGKMASR